MRFCGRKIDHKRVGHCYHKHETNFFSLVYMVKAVLTRSKKEGRSIVYFELWQIHPV